MLIIILNKYIRMGLVDYVKYLFSPCIFTLHLMISIDPMASTATLKYRPKI